MNKKVGLAIVTYTINYGTYLQAFATQEYIKKIGYETEIINIESVIKDVEKRRRKYFFSRLLNFSEVKSYLPAIKLLVNKKINKKFRGYYLRRKKKFDEFHDRFFKIGPICDSWSGLESRCLNFSSVVVGSDQLWRPANIAGNFYTLNFVPKNINKISYATSFGLNEIRKKQRDTVRSFLDRIQFLSTREESGATIIKACTGRVASVVCDPTMLLTSKEWNSYAGVNPLVEDKYVFIYMLNDNKKQRQYIKNFAKQKSLKIVGVLHGAGFVKGDDKFVDEAPADIGPFEFLNLIKNASYVFTDSFHGSVFSILFEKQLFVFKRFSDKNKMSTNSRVINLLSRLGLSNRLIEKETKCYPEDIHYKKVNEKLSLFRKYSEHFLTEALNAGAQKC